MLLVHPSYSSNFCVMDMFLSISFSTTLAYNAIQTLQETLLKSKTLSSKIHAFFYKQHFYKQRQAEIG